MNSGPSPVPRSCALGAALLACLAGNALAQVDAARATEPPTRFDGHRVVRAELRTARDFLVVSALTDDIWTESIRRAGPIDFRVTPEQFAALGQTRLRFEVLIEDVQRAIDDETAEIRALAAADGPGWYDSYHNYTDNKAYCQGLAAAYPGLAQYFVAGLSVQGREIFGLRITGPGPTASRPATLWWGGQHAREWVNVPVTEYCAERLLTDYATDARVRYLVDNMEFLFIPIMNPDGYDYTWTNNRLWRKNRRQITSSCFGVDLNRNWGHQWGGQGASTQCSNDTYRGPSAFSEAETQVMRDLIIANPRIVTTMDLHSYGQLIMSPWGYTAALPEPPAMAAEFQARDDAMAAAIFAVHGRVYEAGPVHTTIYPASGVSVDWAWGARGIKGFTIELRAGDPNGFILAPEQIIPTSEENFAAFLALSEAYTPCYANCDGSTAAPVLNVSDFGCFLGRYAAGEAYANCDGSTVAPVLNVQDFGCFLQRYAAGCP